MIGVVTCPRFRPRRRSVKTLGHRPPHGTDGAEQPQLLRVYEENFEPLRMTELVLVEITVLGSPSLPMWREYPGAQIFGIDVNPEAEAYADGWISSLFRSVSVGVGQNPRKASP